MIDDNKKYKKLSRRAVALGLLKLGAFGAIASRYYYLQYEQAGKYKVLSDLNRIKITPVLPARGMILDRRVRKIADNELFYKLVVDCNHISRIKDIIAKVERLLGKKIQASDKDLEKLIKTSGTKFPIVIHDELTWHDIVKLETDLELPGIEILPWLKRRYLYSTVFSHITGYIAKNSGSVEDKNIGNYIGKSGVEKAFEEKLRGHPGFKKVEVNALGRHVRDICLTPGTPGEDINLSIDLDLQARLAKKLSKFTGSAVLMDATNGQILAMHSSPCHNPSYFARGITHEEWSAISNDPSLPLINKAISAAYSPGSIYKIITALAYLNRGGSAYDKFHCPGHHVVAGRKFHCWNRAGHGKVNLYQAMARSCNVYMFKVAEKIGIDEMLKVSHALGLGERTGIELPFEVPGLLPTRAWQSQKLKGRWFIGDTVNASIGQGYLLATPLQLATMILRLVTSKEIKPTILCSREETTSPEVAIDKEHMGIVSKALERVFGHHTGTGYKHLANDRSFSIAGKTGTTQVVSTKFKNVLRDHGLFVGFTPAVNPKFIISVALEHTGWASKSALPFALEFLQENREYLSSI